MNVSYFLLILVGIGCISLSLYLSRMNLEEILFFFPRILLYFFKDSNSLEKREEQNSNNILSILFLLGIFLVSVGIFRLANYFL